MWRAGEGGFTLIEALVALAILSLVVVTMAAGTSKALRVEASALDHMRAATLADAKMSEIAALPPVGLEAFAEPKTGRFAAGNERYSWSARVLPVEESGHLLRALVRVSWLEGAVELSTVIHREPRLISGRTPWVSP